MKVLGVVLNKPAKADILPIGVVTLIGLLLMYPLSMVVVPQTILAWVFAGFTGAMLAAMGVNAREGLKHIVLIVLCCLPMAMLGHVVGVVVLGLSAG